jgi:hypothetical protein
MHTSGIFAEAKGYMYTDGNLPPSVFDRAEVAGSGSYPGPASLKRRLNMGEVSVLSVGKLLWRQV